MSDKKLKEQLKTYSKEKLLDILIDFVNVCHKQEKIIKEAREFTEKSKLNPLNTYCKYLYIDFDTGTIEHLDELIAILKGDDKE